MISRSDYDIVRKDCKTCATKVNEGFGDVSYLSLCSEASVRGKFPSFHICDRTSNISSMAHQNYSSSPLHTDARPFQRAVWNSNIRVMKACRLP